MDKKILRLWGDQSFGVDESNEKRVFEGKIVAIVDIRSDRVRRSDSNVHGVGATTDDTSPEQRLA